MFQKCFYLFTLINLSQSENYLSYDYGVVDDALGDAAKFFERLKSDYASAAWSPDVKREIDQKVYRYIENAGKRELQRDKREKSKVDRFKGTRVLQGFERDLTIPLKEIDLTFFPVFRAMDILWFAASVNSTGISIYHLHANHFTFMGFYRLEGAVRVMADNYSSGTLLIVGKINGGLTILKLTGSGRDYVLNFAQNLEPPDTNYVESWQGMNQLYLGIAGRNYISVYVWLGEHFDLIQTLNFGAIKLIAFESKGFMHIVAAGSRTILLRHCLRTNRFTTVQKLPASTDVATYRLDGNRFVENFLCLSTVRSTIIYKQLQDRFVPFQDLPFATQTVPLLPFRKTILLASLHEGNVTIHQYDGWRFIKTNIRLTDLTEIRSTNLYNNRLLMTRDRANAWNVERPVWMWSDSSETLQNQWESWCLQTKSQATASPRKIVETNGPVKILNGQIGRLKVQNVNGVGVKILENLTTQRERIESELKKERELLRNVEPQEGQAFADFHARKVRIECTGRCEIHEIFTETKAAPSESITKLRKLHNAQQSLQFKKIKVNLIDDFPCPVPAVHLDNVVVEQTINGMRLKDLQENALKTSGDQEIGAEHTYENFDVTSASVPLDIVANSTKRQILAEVVKVNRLNFTEGGIFLPLNGPATTIISGTITAKKVKLTGLIDLKGHLVGKAVQNPVHTTYGVLQLNGTYDLRYAKTLNLFSAADILRRTGKSLKNVIINAILLDADVPVHLQFTKDNAKWNNVIPKPHPNWVTAASKHTLFISARKYAAQSLTLSSPADVPLPKLDGDLCGDVAILPEIKSSSVVFDRLIARNLRSSNSLGARKLNEAIFDAATSLEPVDFSVKRLTGVCAVKRASISIVNGIDFTGLRSILRKWKEPNVFQGIIRVSDMAVVDLHVSAFEIPTPRVGGNVTAKTIHVDTINRVNVINLLQNVINIESMVALANIRFDGGLKVNNINAVNCPLPVVKIPRDNIRFNTTIFTEELKAKHLNLPYDLSYPLSDHPSAVSLIIHGSASMENEPLVERVNGISPQKAINEAWMKNEKTSLSATCINLKNITLQRKPLLNGRIGTPNFGPWSNISEILLSKSKSQEINVPAFFNAVQASKVLGGKTSTLKTTISRLEDLLKFSLLKNATQSVNGTWHFEQLRISGNFNPKSTVNGMNLSSDVARHDAGENYITGKKTVLDLSTHNLEGFGFAKWAENVLMSNDVKNERTKPIVVKGQKIFNVFNAQNSSVEGTVMGRNINDALLKSTRQDMLSSKEIKGYARMNGLLTDSLINDVNLTELANYSLKKQESVQRIKHKIILNGNLVILGNLKVDGVYQDVQLKSLKYQNETLKPVIGRTTKITKIAQGIHVALQNRAVYIDKLATYLDDDTRNFSSCVNKDALPRSFTFDKLGECQAKDAAIYCDGEKVLYLNLRNSSDLVMFAMLSFRNVPLVIYATSTSVSMYSVNDAERKFYRVADLYVLNVMEASAVASEDSVWIVTRIPQELLILRYEVWGGLQRYVLPGSSPFLLSKAPNNEVLLTRFDGVWILEGVTGPRHALKMSLPEPIEACSIDADYYIRFITEELLEARYVTQP